MENTFLQVREKVNKILEKARTDKVIGAGLEAKVRRCEQRSLFFVVDEVDERLLSLKSLKYFFISYHTISLLYLGSGGRSDQLVVMNAHMPDLVCAAHQFFKSKYWHRIHLTLEPLRPFSNAAPDFDHPRTLHGLCRAFHIELVHVQCGQVTRLLKSIVWHDAWYCFGLLYLFQVACSHIIVIN